MLKGPSIGAWGLWVAWGAVSGPKTKSLPSSAEGFLEAEEAETLLEERLAMQQV